MSNGKEVDIVEVVELRKVLKQFNEDLGQYINSDERFKLGRVLTIIDASIADREQRKAIKDLVQNEWWNTESKASEGAMYNPHTDIRALCTALGFELYDPRDDSSDVAVKEDRDNYVVERYKNIILTKR